MEANREVTSKSLAAAGSTLVAAMFNGMGLASIAISVFIGQIASDYRWDRAQVAGAVTFLYIGVAIGSPIFGKIVDRHGPRAVLLPLTVVSGLTLASFSFVGASLPLFYAAHVLLGLAQPGVIAYGKLLSTWFFRHRGIALTTLGIGAFVAQVAGPPILRALQGTLGWRGSYRALALAELLIAVPVLFAFFRERKSTTTGVAAAESREVRPDGAPEITFRKAVTGKTYWLLVGAQVAATFAFMGTSTHAVGIMTERGVQPAFAVWGLSIFASGGLVARLLTGYLLDRFNTPRVILPFAVGALASLALLHIAHGEIMTFAALILFGFTCGGQAGTTSYLTTRYFGVRNFSTISGSLFPILMLLSAPAPIVIGAIFDATGSYNFALIAMEAALTVTIVFFWLLKPYPYPVKPDGVSTDKAVPEVPPVLSIAEN